MKKAMSSYFNTLLTVFLHMLVGQLTGFPCNEHIEITFLIPQIIFSITMLKNSSPFLFTFIFNPNSEIKPLFHTKITVT